MPSAVLKYFCGTGHFVPLNLVIYTIVYHKDPLGWACGAVARTEPGSFVPTPSGNSDQPSPQESAAYVSANGRRSAESIDRHRACRWAERGGPGNGRAGLAGLS